MTRTVLVRIFSALLVSILAFLFIYYHKRTIEPEIAEMARSASPSSEVTLHPISNINNTRATVIKSNDTVSPLFDLDSMIEDYTADTNTSIDYELALLESRNKWEKYKANGGTLWSAESWMKPKEYYQGLNTSDLTSECFDRPIFHLEMALFDNPRFGLQRLEIMHNGFAELLSREDLCEGILKYYDDAAGKIKHGQDPEVIVLQALNLSELSKLFIYSPAFKNQIKGKEKLFVQAQIASLESFDEYLNDTKNLKWDDVGLFFREPVVVSETALMLVESVDEHAFHRIKSDLEHYRMSRAQNPAELEKYLKEVISLFRKEYLRD